MANPTLFQLATTTVGSATTFVTFSNIPQVYTDLKIIVSARAVSSSNMPNLYMVLNGTNSGYSGKLLTGNGSSASSSNAGVGSSIQTGVMDGSSQTASTFGNAEIYIPNYTSSNYKSISADAVAENNATAGNQTLTASLSTNTSAINTILFFSDANFDVNSTFTLYGVRNY
jgi:hypothetical protein